MHYLLYLYGLEVQVASFCLEHMESPKIQPSHLKCWQRQPEHRISIAMYAGKFGRGTTVSGYRHGDWERLFATSVCMPKLITQVK